MLLAQAILPCVNDFGQVPVGGTTPDTHGRSHGLCLQGRPSPQEGALRGTILFGDPREAREDILKMLRDLIGYIRSHVSCNLLLLSGYLSDLTDL